jgi:hypothetical protein
METNGSATGDDGETGQHIQPGISVENRAERLKERIYITFTALAVVLTLASHSEGLTPGRVATTLLIVVGGAVLAVFVADVVAHITVHRAMPTAAEARHMLAVSFGALGAVVLPMAFLGVAALGGWEVEQALRASTIALVATLAAVGYLAVRRLRIRWWQRLVVLFAEVALGVAVVGLELLAHSA